MNGASGAIMSRVGRRGLVIGNLGTYSMVIGDLEEQDLLGAADRSPYESMAVL